MNKVVDTYYRENYNALIKRSKNRLGSIQDAEDAVQDAFVNALKYFESCSIDFDRWFKVILSNACKKVEREKRAAGLTKSIDDAMDEVEPHIPDHIKDHFRNHMEQLANAKVSYNKEVVRLHILYGYTSKEISELLGISNDLAKKNISLFVQEVREIYE